jgi:hypothetical protein
MNIRSQEQLFASLHRGMQATADLAIALPLLTERRESLIREAIMAFQARYPSDHPQAGKRKYDGQEALLFVAALAENQRLRDDLEYTERQGRKDGKQLQES